MTLAEHILSILAEIENGDIDLALEDMEGENPIYRASNGWGFRVFNDVGDFDYIDACRYGDGAPWIDVPAKVLVDYKPSPDQQMAVWHWSVVRRRLGHA